jgi:hypothetical protein
MMLVPFVVARSEGKPLAVPTVDLLVLIEDQWPRPDKRHLAAKNVEELRNSSSDLRLRRLPKRVIRGSLAILKSPSVSFSPASAERSTVGAVDHRAELENVEHFAVLPDAMLTEGHRRPAPVDTEHQVEHEAWVLVALTGELHMTTEQIEKLDVEEARQLVLDHWARPMR